MDGPDFAALLRRYRRRSGLTQEELAERAGLSLASVSLLERGVTHAPQKATVDMLSAALALPPQEAAEFLAKARTARQVEHDGAPHAPADLTYDDDLPIPLTPLLGREREQMALLELLGRATTRLLTLTGPAGVGKTRLALELSATLRHERRQEVVFVGLIPVQEPERVLPAIAQALGVRESDDATLREALVQALRDRSIVLALDNFEHVAPAARAVLELLIACPRAKALVTSRAALNVRGERAFPVAPLALPDSQQLDSLEELRRAPAVALFVERASAIWPTFDITTLAEGRLVAEICLRLDGLPLAIELAAARVRHVGLLQLRDQVAAPAFLGVLAGGPHDLADHQRTMRSTIAWSYDLLGAEEQRLFRWLGVFVGGVTMDALEAVTGLADEALLADLAALVDTSLLQWTEARGTRRYTQLATLRAYAAERLRASGEWDEARRGHAGYFLELAELSFLATWDQLEDVTARVEADYENMRAALSWAWETGATLHGLRMAGALRRFWESRSYFLEGLDWLERFIARAGSPQNREERAALAEAWTGVVVMSHRLDRFEQARDAGEKALALRRELGDKTAIAWALNNLANPIVQLRDFERAQMLYEEALAIHRETNYRQGQVFPLLNLGEVYYATGRPQEALAYYEQSIAISREVGETDWARALTWNSVGEAYIVLNEPARAIEVTEPSYLLFVRARTEYFAAICAFTLGRARWRLGDSAAACACLDEAERLFRDLGNLSAAARVLYFRASLALDHKDNQGDLEAARRDLTQALADLSGQSHDRENIWLLVERAGTLACRQGAPQVGARLYSAAIARRNAVSPLLEPAERELRARDLACLQSALGEGAFAEAVAAGEALSLDQATAALRQTLCAVKAG